MDEVSFTEMLAAATALIVALTTFWATIQRKLNQVHTLVNSQLDAVMQKLDNMTDQRNTAIDERDAARKRNPEV